MTDVAYLKLSDKYPDKFVATDRDSGMVLAHSTSVRRLYAMLKRKRIAPSQAVLEKNPPRNVVVIY